MQLNCDVINDILPSYADGMVSDTTKQCVEAHLAHCPACRANLKEQQNKEDVILPSVKNVRARLMHANRHSRMRRILPALTAVLVLLTLVAGWLTCAWVPVWISYEDAVISAEQSNRFAFRVYTQPEVYGAYGLVERVDGNSVEAVSFYGYRSDLLFDEPYIKDGFVGFHADNEVWFYGGYTGEEDRLLHGEGISSAQSVVATSRDNRMDRMHNTTLCYVSWGAIEIGAVCLAIGLLLRKRQTGRILMLTALPFICCWLACMFVTDGYMTCSIEWASAIGMGYLRRYVSIGVMTLLMWATAWCGCALVKTRSKK